MDDIAWGVTGADTSRMPRNGPPSPVLGHRIAQLRNQVGWSQPELAVEAGIGVTTLHRAESSDPSVTFATIMKIASALEIAPSEIYVADLPQPNARSRKSLVPQWAVDLQHSLDRLEEKLDRALQGMRS